jgi:tetratricopeptide (TPR) repeat protein
MSKRSHQIQLYFQQGQRLHGAGRLPEAEHLYRQILTAAPTHADARHMLGVLALQAGHPEAAVAEIDRAIALKPSIAAYHVSRANALLALGGFEEAIAACQTALRHNRSSADALQTLGHALTDSRRTEEALAAYRNALRFNPSLPDLHNNLGTALRNLNRLDEAAVQLREALRRTPHDAGVLTNLSSVLKEQGKFDAAETCLRDALRLHPDNPVLHYNLGLLLLLTGRFDEGWRGFEQRFRASAVPSRRFSKPEWHGEPLAGRTLLIYAEQGLGDMIQFSRFLPLVAGRVVFEVPGRMIRVLSGLPHAVPAVAAGTSLPPFDLVCPLMSLPLRLGASIEASQPSLSAEPALAERWRSRIGPHSFKVGIAWQGNPNRHEDNGRSVPLAEFQPLTRIAGVRLISLQRGFGSEQVGQWPMIETFGDELDSGPDAFVDTVAVMANLDLVISTDTAIAHLAGALGRPVWVPLRAVPDWRWMLDRPDSPWYPTMQLFRQSIHGEWAPVFQRIAQQLGNLVGGRQ